MAVFSFGFSPCPNDTFAFWAAVHGVVGDAAGSAEVRFEPVIADIEALNERAVLGHEPLAVTKLSLPALARVTSDYAVLASGAALGFGCGPLVVCREDSGHGTLADLAGARVAIPGRHTTAALLLDLLLPVAPAARVAMRFDEVMPAIAAGAVDAGVIIHESRFTYRDHGLRELADLGVLFEQQSGGPLPLGVIAARRDLGDAAARAIERALAASVRLARAQPELPREWVRRHSQELADDVCDRHIALYVNGFTEDLGAPGRAAIAALLDGGRERGLLPAGPPAFREENV
ncbi:MAG: 1,4-dihydroxy-6-naphthoate synthase [Planctomycetes bacterium]|nr:1,4-dihydroxy-6-naphthoate synthase [Planctomycetota bacterium]